MKRGAAFTLALVLAFGGITSAQAAPVEELDNLPYSAADTELLARLLWSECRGEPYEGQLMVAQCVLDRLADGRWGSTLESVITAPNQFATPGSLDEKLLEVAEAALGGERYDPTVQILYFQVSSSSRDWHAPYLGKVGNHAYYGLPE